MINVKKACLLATVGMMLAPAAVLADDVAHDVVKDARGNTVLSTNGNCVITKWESASDECGMVKHSILAKLTKELRTVYFDFNKSTLNSKEKVKLDEVASIVKESKEVESVDIVGFADKIGAPSYNQRLSVHRAETVKAFLATKGLKTRNIRVEGKGESDSITNCDPKLARKDLISCLAADRRVMIELNLAK